MNSKDNLHKNHRKRVKEKFNNSNLDSFAEHEILEFVLFYAIPYKDTNPIAHQLINYFGSLSDVFNADKDELEKFVSEHVATLIKLIPSVNKILMKENNKKRPKLNGFMDSINYAKNFFAGETQELVFLVCLDNKNQVKATKCISKGTTNQAIVDTKLLTKFILQKDLDRIIITHNHPTGTASPSDQDLLFTKHIITTLSPLGIEVLDHIIISEKDSFSFAHSGILQKIYQTFISSQNSTFSKQTKTSVLNKNMKYKIK